MNADGLIANTRNFGDVAINSAQEWAPRILAAAVILIVGYLIARAVKSCRRSDRAALHGPG